MSKINETLTAMDRDAVVKNRFVESLNDLYTVQNWTTEESLAFEQFLNGNPDYRATRQYLNKKLTESFNGLDYSEQSMLVEDLSAQELAQIKTALTSLFDDDVDDYKVISNDDNHVELSFCIYSKPNKIKIQREIYKILAGSAYDDDINVMFADDNYNSDNPEGNYIVVSAYKE